MKQKKPIFVDSVNEDRTETKITQKWFIQKRAIKRANDEEDDDGENKK